jgi:hypothetical protein
MLFRTRKDPLPCSFTGRESSTYHCHSFQLFSFSLSHLSKSRVRIELDNNVMGENLFLFRTHFN